MQSIKDPTNIIKKALKSHAFIKELEQISSYASNIRQERPIVYLLAKHLNMAGTHKVILEYKTGKGTKCDLLLDGSKVEAKFHYTFDIHQIDNEIKHPQKIKKNNTNWVVLPLIDKDMKNKKPDIFIWIICARDLSVFKNIEALTPSINWWEQQLRAETKIRKNIFKDNKYVQHKFMSYLRQYNDNYYIQSVILPAKNGFLRSKTSKYGCFRSKYYFFICSRKNIH